MLIERAALPELHPGDLLAVPATGAYNASMASNYNRLPRPAAVMVADGEAELVQRRETMEDLLARERVGEQDICAPIARTRSSPNLSWR